MIDHSIVGVAREHYRFYASCWKCDRNAVPVSLDNLPADAVVTRLKPRCRICGTEGQWTIIPICTIAMKPKPENWSK